jgi:DNA-directed RNA polymerase alpha subunit
MASTPLSVYIRDRAAFERLRGLSREDLLATLVVDVPFATRAHNAMRKASIVTLADLTAYSPLRFTRLKNSGVTTTRHVEAFLAELGLTLAHAAPQKVRLGADDRIQRARELLAQMRETLRALDEMLR